MRDSVLPRIPAALPALGALAGAWAAQRASASAAAAALWLAWRLAPRSGLGGRAAALLAAAGLVLGYAAGRWEQAHRAALQQAWGESQESLWELEVLRAPEAEPRGGRVFLARLEPQGLRVRVRVGGRNAARLENIFRGDRLRAWGRLEVPPPAGHGTFDALTWLRTQGADASLWIKSASLLERVAVARGGLGRRLDRVRVAARRALLREETSAADLLVLAMVLGEREGLSRETERILRDAGLGHLLAISGLHLGLLAWLLSASWKRMARFVPWGALFCGLFLLFYAHGTGGRIPAWRAAAMVCLAFAGRLLGREAHPLNALAWAALALLLWRPAAACDLSYGLSFLATAGILTLSAPLASRLPLPRALALACAVSGSAYVATAPLLAWSLARLAPIALATNLVAAPLCVCILGGAVLALAEAALPGGGFGAGVAVARGGAAALLGTAKVASEIRGGSLWVTPWPPIVAAFYYVCLVEVVLHASKRNECTRGRPWALALWGLLVLVHLGPPPFALRAGSATVDVLDVGQGQAVLVRDAEGRCALADAATGESQGDAVRARVLPALARAGCTRLEALWLSHADADHAGGAPAVIAALAPARVLYALAAWQEFQAMLGGSPRPHTTAYVGVEAGSASGLGEVRFEVLHPPATCRGSSNERSLLLRLKAGACTALVPGDLEVPGEKAVLESEAELASELLLLGHHGAADATSEAWLDAVRPRMAAVSVGARNPFGHPAPAVLERLERRRIPLWRTDRHGSLSAVCTERRWIVRASREPR